MTALLFCIPLSFDSRVLIECGYNRMAYGLAELEYYVQFFGIPPGDS